MRELGAGSFLGTRRFRIVERLGDGGYGTVYRVFDTERGEDVALKMLRKINPKSLYRFKKEFRALAEMRHPNLVSLYELLSDGQQWFFTMELVEGKNFIEYVHGHKPEPAAEVPENPDAPTYDFSGSASEPGEIKPRKRLRAPETDYRKLRHALRQLTEGLIALHLAGKLHRDIKPPNVRVTPEGHVILLDFGLVTELIPHDLMQSVDLVGSPAYMSPEQGCDKPVSAASDWYNVGVMLFEALTGQFPFIGGFAEVLLRKQEHDPPVPSSLVTGVPPDLDELCLDLLRRDPEQRPTGSEILRRLGGPTATSRAVTPITGPLVELVGRKEHLNALRSAYETTLLGQPVTALIRGGSGMGKTALVRFFLSRLQLLIPEPVILRGKCYAQESVPYKALDSLIDDLTRYLMGLPQVEAAMLMPRNVLALAELFPVLRRVDVIDAAGERQVRDPQELRSRAFAALRGIFARMADRRPLILFIDDLQWGDADSINLLSEMLRPPDPPNLLLLVSQRDGPDFESSPLHELFSTPSPGNAGLDLREIPLGPMSADESLELANLLLSEMPDGNKSAGLIAAECGGSPLYIQELTRYAREQQGTTLELPAENPEGTLLEMLQKRLASLPRSSRLLLAVSAIYGRPVPIDIAYQACRLSTTDSAPVDHLSVNQLIRSSQQDGDVDTIEPYHERIQKLALADIEPIDIAMLSGNLANALENSKSADPDLLARLYKSVGETAKAARFTALAAQRASRQLAFHKAAGLFKEALELDPQIDNSRELQIAWADILALLGRGTEAGNKYLKAAEGADEKTALPLKRRASEQLLRSGHIGKGLTVMRELLDQQGIRYHESPTGAALSFVLRRAQLKLRGLRFVPRRRDQIPRELAEKVDISWSAANGLSVVDVIRGADFQTRNLLFALKAGDLFAIARAMATEAAFVACAGGVASDAAEDLLERSETITRELDEPYLKGQLAMTRGIVAYLCGDYANANKMCRRAENIYREQCSGVAWELTSSKIFSFGSLAYMGEIDELRRTMPLYLRESRSRGDMYAQATLRPLFYTLVLLADDDPRSAQREIDSAGRDWSYAGFHVQHQFKLVGQGQLLLYTDDPYSALEHIDRAYPQLKRSQMLRIQNVRAELGYLRGRALVSIAAMEANPTQTISKALSEAARLERERMPWIEAYGLLIYAGVATVRGRIEQAILHLGSAERGFDAAGMKLLSAAARRRRGELTSGSHGRKLVEEADAWMATQKIKNPGKMTGAFVPPIKIDS